MLTEDERIARHRQACRSWYVRNQLRHSLMRHHKMTVEEYDVMLLVQDGKCAICGEYPKEGKRLEVDHDHSIADQRLAVRGLLCHACNVDVAYAEENGTRDKDIRNYLALYNWMEVGA